MCGFDSRAWDVGYKDKDKQREYQRKWMAARRFEFFKDKCCVVCGSTDSLELDHIDPREKVHHRIWSWSAERRDAEIAKCQVLCRQCHIAKSIEQLPITHGYVPYQHGSKSMYDRHNCRCAACRAGNARRMREWRARAKPRQGAAALAA